jgi:hypothetical protein
VEITAFCVESFSVGDEVLVEFKFNQDQPKVIGWKKEPKSCTYGAWMQPVFLRN